MKRREFITLLGGAAAWPLAARALHAEGLRRIGYLSGTGATGTEEVARGAALLPALQQLGWTDGRNIKSIIAGAMAHPSRLANTLLNWWR